MEKRERQIKRYDLTKKNEGKKKKEWKHHLNKKKIISELTKSTCKARRRRKNSKNKNKER